MNVHHGPDGRAVMEAFGIGDTPLVRLPGVTNHGSVWLKAEYCNPYGSVKDRTAAYLLAWALAEAGPNVSVVESTSGNLGVALAHLSHDFGVPVTLVMDASLPQERIDEVRALDAHVHVVEECRAGMTFRESRIAVARDLGRRPGWLWLNQYANEAGLRAHEETTGPEIWTALDRRLDVLVASVGTGGTLCGIGAALRGLSNPPLIVGVEPVGSTISGGADGDYLPAGSGMRGVPEIIERHAELVDYFAKVPDALAAAWAMLLLSRFDLEVGQTTGAAVAVAAMLAEERDAPIAAIAADRGQSFYPSMRALLAQADIRPGATDTIQMVSFRGTGSLPPQSHRR